MIDRETFASSEGKEKEENLHQEDAIIEHLSVILENEDRLDEETDCETKLLPKGPFVYYTNSNEKSVIIPKSILCWLLSNDYNKLSSDRLHRVKNALTESNEVLPKSKNSRKNDIFVPENDLIVNEQIALGNWCAFYNKKSKKFIVGRIISFAYTKGKGKQLIYSASTAPIKPPRKNSKGILCS